MQRTLARRNLPSVNISGVLTKCVTMVLSSIGVSYAARLGNPMNDLALVVLYIKNPRH